MKFLRVALRVVLGLAVAWAISLGAMIAMARSLIYPFADGIDAARAVGVPGATALTVAAEDGTPLVVWLAGPREGMPVIIHFMGNAGSLPHSAPRLAEFAHRGYGIAALNYRGAGGQPGEPSEDALISDALTVYDTLDSVLGQEVPVGRRVLHGTSLGAALAVQVAARRGAAALVLETPFNRLCEVAQFHYPIYPVCLVLPFERWASADVIDEVNAPILIQHGDADGTIPLSQGRALYDAAPDPKRLIVYPGGGHNDLHLYGAGQDAIAFIEAVTDR